jgi:hypothetical protein
MNSTAVILRHDHGVARQGRVQASTGGGVQMQAATRRLLDYWRHTLPLPVSVRRRALDVACAGTHREAAPDVLAFALGDTDDDIVFRATLAHVGACPLRDHDAAAAAVDWVRRRLALNCAAVFAALLSLGEERLFESLLPLRSTLDAREVAAVRRRLEKACPEPARNFLRAWSDLLDQSGVPVCGDRAVRSADARSGGRRVHAAEPGIDVA